MKNNHSMEEKINAILDDLRTYLVSHGGDLEFIKYEDNYVFVKMTGSCHHCAYQKNTLNDAIYETLRKEIPEIKGVINVEL